MVEANIANAIHNVCVSDTVSLRLFPGQPDHGVWKFDYLSSTADPGTVFVDDVSGQIVTGLH